MANTVSQLDQYVERYVAGLSTNEIGQQRAGFFSKNGEIFADDPFFERRISFFHYQVTFGQFAGLREMGCDELELTLNHGLFRIIRFWGNYAKVRDLMLRKNIWVNCLPAETAGKKQFLGFKKKDVFQGYLVKDGKHFVMTKAIFVHPFDSYPHILAAVRKLPRNPDPDLRIKTLERLSRVQLLSQRQQSTQVGVFYSSTGAFGVQHERV